MKKLRTLQQAHTIATIEENPDETESTPLAWTVEQELTPEPTTPTHSEDMPPEYHDNVPEPLVYPRIEQLYPGLHEINNWLSGKHMWQWPSWLD